MSRFALVPLIPPALGGVVDRLQSGARVADVGRGAGVAVLAVADPANLYYEDRP